MSYRPDVGCEKYYGKGGPQKVRLLQRLVFVESDTQKLSLIGDGKLSGCTMRPSFGVKQTRPIAGVICSRVSSTKVCAILC